MIYRYDREDLDTAIGMLVEYYPRCFFIDSEKRRPLKRNLATDLVKEGVALPRELIDATLTWYESHFAYQYALEPGAKRIDLHGKEVGTVTELEARAARKYIHDRKQEQRERKQEEQRKRTENVVVEKISSLKIAQPPMLNANVVKEIPPMPKAAVKTDNALAPIQELLDATRNVHDTQPEPFAACSWSPAYANLSKRLRRSSPPWTQREIIMGEAKRKAAARAHAAGARSWAIGFVVVWANDWSGTKQDAINLQKKFLDAANTLGIECQSYATEAACYAMTFGMPQAGAEDYRPSRFGEAWDANEVEA
jgi:sRNA-binding protein